MNTINNAEIILSLKLIRDKIVLVDKDDFLKYGKYKWTFDKYAVRFVKGKKVYLHRLIMDCPKNMEVDHINGNELDCRKNNMRICTHAENSRNIKLRTDNTSGYKGVSWYKNYDKWLVRVFLNNKKIHIGYFENKNEAVTAYNEAAIKYHGRFARINKI